MGRGEEEAWKNRVKFYGILLFKAWGISDELQYLVA